MASSGVGSLTDLPGMAPAGLGDWQVQIGDVLMGPGTSYLITGREGFGSPDVRSTDVAKTLDDGDWMGRDSYASRVLTLTIVVRGTSPADATAQYEALQQAWYSDPAAPFHNLWWRFPGVPAQRAIGKPRRIQANKSRLLQGRIDVVAEFYSPYAPLFGEDVTLTATPKIVTGGGRSYPLVYPKTYSLTVSGGQSQFATNSGSYPSWMLLTFSGGAASSPRLYNLTTGAFCGFDVVMAAGDVLEVDMRLRTATLNGQNVRTKLTAGSEFFSLPPGETAELLLTAFSADPTFTCAITYTPATLG